MKMTKKLKFILSLTVLVFILTSFAFYQAMLIIPGQSVGHFFLNKTTLRNVKSYLGKGEIKKLKWFAPHCGMTRPSYLLVYEDKGISFTFYTGKLKNNNKIESIALTKNFIAHTEKHIAVGYSTRADIYNAYGNPADTSKDMHIAYTNLGISFEFGNSTNQKTDTLTTMYIYEPTVNN